jgi:hypothetical protein
MSTITVKILAGVLQMHSPDATLQSDNKGIDTILGVVREQMTETANPAPAAANPNADEAHVILVRKGGPYTKGFGKTIFRKGEYGKSVHGPQYRRIILD